MSERRLAAVRRGRMGQGAQAAITVAHASGNGVSASDPNHFLAFGSGLCQVLRMKGEFDFAVNAGAMADWTSPGEKAPREMPSSDSKAFCFACRNSSPGSGAKQRAAFCRQKGSQHGERVDAN